MAVTSEDIEKLGSIMQLWRDEANLCSNLLRKRGFEFVSATRSRATFVDKNGQKVTLKPFGEWTVTGVYLPRKGRGWNGLAGVLASQGCQSEGDFRIPPTSGPRERRKPSAGERSSFIKASLSPTRTSAAFR